MIFIASQLPSTPGQRFNLSSLFQLIRIKMLQSETIKRITFKLIAPHTHTDTSAHSIYPQFNKCTNNTPANLTVLPLDMIIVL